MYMVLIDNRDRRHTLTQVWIDDVQFAHMTPDQLANWKCNRKIRKDRICGNPFFVSQTSQLTTSLLGIKVHLGSCWIDQIE